MHGAENIDRKPMTDAEVIAMILGRDPVLRLETRGISHRPQPHHHHTDKEAKGE